MPVDDLGKVEQTTIAEKKLSAEICNVIQCDVYLSCTECYSKLTPVDGVCGEYTGYLSCRNVLRSLW